MDHSEAAELVDAFIFGYEERRGYPPAELRVSGEIYAALAEARSHLAFEHGGVRLYMDVNLEPETVELA